MMKKDLSLEFLKILVVIAILVLLTGVAQAEDWPMYRHDPAHTGATSEVAKPPLKLLWKFEVEGGITPPIIYNGTVYVGSNYYESKSVYLGSNSHYNDEYTWMLNYHKDKHRDIYALDAKTGGLKWKFEPEADIKGLAVLDKIVYVVSAQYDCRALYALDAKTGELKWKKEYYAVSPPVVSNKIVYVHVYHPRYHGSYIYALDAKTGELIWEFPIKATQSVSQPAVSDRILYFCSNERPVYANGLVYQDHYVYALDAETGELRRKFKIDETIVTSSPPSVSNGIVYVISKDSIYAIDTKGEDIKWKFKANGSLKPIEISNGSTYVTSSWGSVYALDAKSGEIKWKFDDIRRYPSQPTVSDEIVYVQSSWISDSHIYALDSETGELIWKSINIYADLSSDMAISDGIAYITGRGSVYAFAPTSWEDCASSYISYARDVIAEAEKIGADTTHAKELLNKADNAKSERRYSEAANYAVQAAEETYAYLRISLAQDAIEKAERVGADTTYAKKYLYEAKHALEKTNYLEATPLANSAKDQAEGKRRQKLSQYGLITLAVSLTLASSASFAIRRRRISKYKVSEIKAKTYSHLESTFGAGIGLGWGFGIGFLAGVVEVLFRYTPGSHNPGIGGFFYIIILCVAGAITSRRLHGRKKAMYLTSLFFIGITCVAIAYIHGIIEHHSWSGTSSYYLMEFTLLYPLVLSIPFGILGTIKGYWIGKSISEELEKIEAYKKKIEEWKKEGYGVSEFEQEWLK